MLNKVFALMSLFTAAPQTSSLALKEQPILILPLLMVTLVNI